MFLPNRYLKQTEIATKEAGIAKRRRDKQRTSAEVDENRRKSKYPPPCVLCPVQPEPRKTHGKYRAYNLTFTYVLQGLHREEEKGKARWVCCRVAGPHHAWGKGRREKDGRSKRKKNKGRQTPACQFTREQGAGKKLRTQRASRERDGKEGRVCKTQTFTTPKLPKCSEPKNTVRPAEHNQPETNNRIGVIEGQKAEVSAPMTQGLIFT